MSEFGLRIFTTGIRNGETLIGVGTQNKGTILETRISDEDEENLLIYPPSLQGVASLSQTDITNKLRLIPFFENMKPKDRLKWLTENATKNNDLYLSDSEIQFEVKIIKLAGKFMIDNYSDVPTDEWFTIKQLEQRIPLKPGSKGLRGRSTLIFRPSNFELYLEPQVEEWKGLYIKLEDGNAEVDSGKIKLSKLNTEEKNYKIVTFENSELSTPNFAIIYSTERKTGYTWDEIYKLAPKELRADMKEAKIYLDRYTISPAFFKSLLQKIIRFRALKCEFVDENNELDYLDAKSTLLACLSHLLLHSGSFVATIRRFVSGPESAFKRLAISICEDSYTENHFQLLSLFCCAALAQREKHFIPSTEMVKTLFELALETQSEAKCFRWKLGTLYEFEKDELKDSLFNCYNVLTHVKSFETDIQMLSYIAKNNGKHNKKYDFEPQLESFPVYRALDHHVSPDICYFFKYPLYNIDYSKLFKLLWDVSSSYNPRKRTFITDENKKIKTNDKERSINDVYEEILMAQELCSLTKFPNKNIQKIKREESDKIEKFVYKLDKSWLAGLIGPIQVKNAYVVLRTDFLETFAAIKKPSRTDKNPELTDDEKEDVINQAKSILNEGIKLKKCPPALSKFEGVTVKFDIEEEKYSLKIGKKWKLWEDCLKLKSEVEVYENETEYNDNFYTIMKTAIQETGEGVEKDWNEILNKILNDWYEKDVIRKLANTITGQSTEIVFNKIGRDGEGQEYTVSVLDSAVFQILCILCLLIPAGIELNNVSFKIKDAAIWLSIRDIIFNSIKNENENEEKSKWKVKKDKRKLWEHQIDIVNAMKNRYKEGKKGNIMWMQTGSGKTKACTTYMHWLIEQNAMPKYCVYTLPTSAIDSIEKELETAGFEYKLLDCRKGKDQDIQPYIVNIVKHDHLILNEFDTQLKELANECLFIVDEFHKTLNATKRTSVALDAVKLSYNFIALSGTIFKDNDIDLLIAWLQLVNDFEVNKNNFWVAIGSLFSRKIESKTYIDRQFVEVEANDDYYKLVPSSLGGTSNVINFREAVKVSYDLVTQEMINIAKSYLKKGERIFIVAKDIEHQNEIAKALKKYNVFKITKDKQITLTFEDDDTDIQCVITTIRMSEGYSLSLIHIGLTSIYFSNNATREQLVGRLDRMNQKSDTITWITVHSAILSYIHEKYENVRSIAAALKGFAKDIKIDEKDLEDL